MIPRHCLLIMLICSPPVALARTSSFQALVTQVFSKYDANDDGILTTEELDHPAWFSQADDNGDGRLTRDEATQFLRRHATLYADANRAAKADSLLKLNSVSERVRARTFPSLFMAWSSITNLPNESTLQRMARHDLVFGGVGLFGLAWEGRPSGLAERVVPATIEMARRRRAELQTLNPNAIVLAEIRYRDASRRFLPASHPWWKRDKNGELIVGWAELNLTLLDCSNPEFQEHVARRAKAVIDTGVFDGIMMDWWVDDDDRLALVRRIREKVGDEPMILVNANDRQTPRTAAYVNGYFMECYRSKTRQDWDRIAETLRFAETHLREPRLNCVETWYEHSRRDLNRMRATTCLVLTQSDGYCLFSDPNDLPSPDHRHDWYPFWKKRLGKPIGPGVTHPDGSSRREFDAGTAFYNPMGNPEQKLTFTEPRLSLATGRVSRTHTVAALDGDIFLKQQNTASSP